MKNIKVSSQKKIIILGVLLNMFTILLFAVRLAFTERLFYSTIIFEKIFSLALCIMWYIFLLKYKKENKKMKAFNWLNIIILIFILLGNSYFYMPYTEEEKFQYMFLLFFPATMFSVDLGETLIQFLKITISGFIYTIFVTTIFSKISNKSEKGKKISIIYLPSIYCMVLSGIFILKTMPFFKLAIFSLISIIIEILKIKSESK